MEEQKLTIGKGIILTLVIVVICALLVVLMTILGIPMWIPFLGLVLCTATGVSFNVKSIVQFWLSIVVGLGIGFLLGNIEQLGVIAIVLSACGILLMIFGMATQRMSAIFNAYTAAFVTVGTAQGVVLELIPLVKGILFGFIVLGLLPCFVIKAMTGKKKEENTEA